MKLSVLNRFFVSIYDLLNLNSTFKEKQINYLNSHFGQRYNAELHSGKNRLTIPEGRDVVIGPRV